MPLNTPPSGGPVYPSLSQPPVGTVLYDRVYNDDLVYIKVRVRNSLKNNGLSHMPMGFPFHTVCDGRGGSYISRESYEFQEHFCPSDQRSRAQTVTFSYTAPPLNNFDGRQEQRMSWRITVPSRESSYMPSKISIAQVEVDPIVMETGYGLEFMTNPRILLEALSISIELGVLITVTVANSKTSIYPTDRNLNYIPGDIIYIATDNNHRSEVAFVCKS